MYEVFLPTVLLSIFMPALTTVLTKLGDRLTEWENYETQDGKFLADTSRSPGC